MAWIYVCETAELSEGMARELVHGGDIIAVYRHRGELFAIDGICLHQGGPLARGRLADGTITCPWHGWQYELSTGNNATTCKPMLKTYGIRASDGKIEVDVPS